MRKWHIVIDLTVKGCNNASQAEDIAGVIVEHLGDTFNEGGCLLQSQFSHYEHRPKRRAIV